MLKALRAGRIQQTPDGTIDPAKADAAWTASTDAGRWQHGANDVELEEEVAVGASGANDSDPGQVPAWRRLARSPRHCAVRVARAPLTDPSYRRIREGSQRTSGGNRVRSARQSSMRKKKGTTPRTTSASGRRAMPWMT